MGSTDPLTGARYPFGSDAATIAQYIQNAVNDLSDNAIPAFTSAALRDTAYANWVAQGNTMRDGLTCRVAGDLYGYKSGSWKREIDAGRPRARLASANQSVPGNGVQFGIGNTPITTLTTGNNGSSFFTQRVDGLDVQAGIYAVTFNIRLVQPGTGIVATSGRSLLTIVGNANTDILSIAPISQPGDAAGTNSTTLFLPAAQQVRFLMFLTCNADPVTVSSNVDIVRLGDF